MTNNNLHDLRGERRDQFLITVDKSGNPIGTATRAQCHDGSGMPHMAFMAFVIDSQKNIVLTKRSSQKSLWAGFWDASVVSHVLPGETVEEAAHRRGKEELGVQVEFKNIGAFYYFAKHGESAENEYCFVLVGMSSEKIDPNPVEISEMKTVSYTQLIQMNEKERNHLAPWLSLALEKINLEGLL
jgi:isopentenyl-diphosphate delta-isomerase